MTAYLFFRFEDLGWVVLYHGSVPREEGEMKNKKIKKSLVRVAPSDRI